MIVSVCLCRWIQVMSEASVRSSPLLESPASIGEWEEGRGGNEGRTRWRYI